MRNLKNYFCIEWNSLHKHFLLNDSNNFSNRQANRPRGWEYKNFDGFFINENEIVARRASYHGNKFFRSDWFLSGERVHQENLFSPRYFHLLALEITKTEIKSFEDSRQCRNFLKIERRDTARAIFYNFSTTASK